MQKDLIEIKTHHHGILNVYTCGPTVYNYVHIGNMRTFLTSDLLVRTAKAIGYKVKHISNITDVGHLTTDDMIDGSGEDKLTKALASKEGESFQNIWELSEYYTTCFIQDSRMLNLLQPNVRPKATQHIQEQIRAIQTLLQKGSAYTTSDGVYFDISTFPEYGKLSGNKSQDQLKKHVRDIKIDSGKRNSADFALWKKDSEHLMQWYSPWGWGFPGWHLECSVMAMEYLGDSIDIHAGGEDLAFPHHECEIAQSESLTGEIFSKYWIHTRYLQVEGEKMSKSKGNFFTLRDLIYKDGYDPRAIRYALISTPFSKPFNFTMSMLQDAAKKIKRFDEILSSIYQTIENPQDHSHSFGDSLELQYHLLLESMCNNLNTSKAIAHVLAIYKEISTHISQLNQASATHALDILKKCHDVLGFIFPASQPNDQTTTQSNHQDTEKDNTPQEILLLLKERETAKIEKNYQKSDEIRAQIEHLGYKVIDTKEGSKIQK